MHLTITTEDDRIVTLDVGDVGVTVENLKAILEAETTIPARQQRLVCNGRELAPPTATLASVGVTNGDLVMLLSAPAAPAAAPAANPAVAATTAAAAAAAAARRNPPGMEQNPDGSAVNPQAFIAAMRANPQLLASITASVPPLAQAVNTDDIAGMQEILRRLATHQKEMQERKAELARLQFADPMDMEAQRRIHELIEQENITQNYESALEHTPESFGQVCMLYVDTEVNGVPLKAFVDSGAQMTIMSVACAERCGIMRLVDRRFSGTAKGVGTAKILGRVHQAPLKIGGAHLTAAVTVLERGDMEFLFGLDMLKRHQCSIDLMSNELKIGTTGSAVPFLSEGQLPMHLRGEEAEQEQWEPVPAEAAASTPATAPTPIAAHPPAPAAAPTAAAAAAAAPTPTAAADGGLDEAAIATLVGLGFPREQALQALQSTGGNVDLAASLLFN